MSASHLKPPSGSVDAINVNVVPFELTIRFSASIPDLQLSVPAKPNFTAAALKQLIRPSLPSEYQARRIRLIYLGRALTDESPLTSVLKRTFSQLQNRNIATGSDDDAEHRDAARKGKSKGKEPVREEKQVINRIYIHCSIGDVVLSASELDAEAKLADRSRLQGGDLVQEDLAREREQQRDQDAATTTPAPRGFDRLLSAGFTMSEVQSLRLQFMAIQAHTHTPDTMPSQDTLRDMEDRWLDNGNASATGPANGSGQGATFDDDASAGALDDMLWGAAMGFFWPVGCLFWGFREDGIWSQRRKMAVIIGLVLNIGIGLIRYTS